MTDTDRQRGHKARQAVAVEASGKWDNPRPAGMGRHTKRYRDTRTEEIVLVHGTRRAPWLRRAVNRRRNAAAKRARRANRG